MRHWLWVPLLFHASIATAGPINLSFETGELTGWHVEQPLGLASFAPDGHGGFLTNVLVPAGTVSTANAFSFEDNYFGTGSTLIDPAEGASFALLNTAATGTQFAFPTQDFDIFISQSFTLSALDVLSGWARFLNGDFLTADSAWVRVLDSAGGLVANPWQQHSGPGPVPLGGTTPWTQWQWQAPTAGTYELQLGVSTFGDGALASYGAFDAVHVSEPSSVPEPSSVSLIVAGLAVVASRARRRRRV